MRRRRVSFDARARRRTRRFRPRPPSRRRRPPWRDGASASDARNDARVDARIHPLGRHIADARIERGRERPRRVERRDGSRVRRHHLGHRPEGVPRRRLARERRRLQDPARGPKRLLRWGKREFKFDAAAREVRTREGARQSGADGQVRTMARLQHRFGPQIHDGKRIARARARPHRRAQLLAISRRRRVVRARKGWKDS